MKIGTIAKRAKPLSVGILGFDGVSLLDLAGPFEAFAVARTDAADGKDQPCYDTRIIGVTGKTFVSESGLVFKTEDTLLRASHVDSIIVPGGVAVRTGETYRKISEWLTPHARPIRRIGSIATGVFRLPRLCFFHSRPVNPP